MSKLKLRMKNGRVIIPSRKKNKRFVDRTGEIHDFGKFGKAKIIRYASNRDLDIQFLNTGYITRNFNYSHVKDKSIKDYLYPTLYNVGCLGEDYKKIKKECKYYGKVYDNWCNMMRRCYSSEHSSFNIYGGAGVTVSDEWLNFSNFFYDFIKLPGFELDDYLSGKLSLDKDKLQQNCVGPKIYSKDTCCLLTPYEQGQYLDKSKVVKSFLVIYPNNEEKTITNISKFCREHNLTKRAVWACMNGKVNHHKGYKFKPIEKCND